MAILPDAIIKIVARHTTPRVGKRGFCLHIAISNGASLYNYFNQPGSPTSHFYVRKSGNTNGMADFEQYVDTKYQAPANLEGNPTLISLETQGGVGDDVNNGWTATQVERIAWILAQCHLIHGIPLKAMRNSLPASTGVGYHRLGIDPWRVDGGELWSTAYGKICPTSAREAQITHIITRAIQIASGEDMLTEAQAAQLAKAGWLADQFAQGAQFETDLDVIRSDLRLTLANIRTLINTVNSFITLSGQRWAQTEDHVEEIDAEGDTRSAAEIARDAALAAALVALQNQVTELERRLFPEPAERGPDSV